MADVLSLNLRDDITPEVFKEIAAALAEKPDADVELRIHSPGGEVTSGYAIANALKAHKGHKTAIIEGLCASAATFPACACDAIHMYPESLFMVHGPWGEVAGGAETMAAQGDLLNKMADLCLVMYQRKTGADEARVRAWMTKDTWMTPAEAMAAGFCDKVLSDSASPQARADVKRFVARLRMTKNPNKGQVKMALSDEMKSKLAKYGLGDDDSPEALKQAFQSYMMDEDDPEMRRQMRAAMADAGDNPANPVVKMEDDKKKEDEESSSDKSKSMKLNQRADLDPVVQKLVGDLTGGMKAMRKELDGYQAKERERELSAYQLFAKDRVDRKDADEYLQLAGGDIARAKAIVAKHPDKSVFGRVTRGGAPMGKDPNASAAEAEPAPIVNGGRHQLHGNALAKQAAARAAKMPDKPGQSAFEKYAQAQREVLKERPDLFV